MNKDFIEGVNKSIMKLETFIQFVDEEDNFIVLHLPIRFTEGDIFEFDPSIYDADVFMFSEKTKCKKEEVIYLHGVCESNNHCKWVVISCIFLINSSGELSQHLILEKKDEKKQDKTI